MLGLLGVIGPRRQRGRFNFLECPSERLFVSTESSALFVLQKLIKASVEP